MPKKIAVIGPGAIGSLFAAKLAQAGHELFLMDRRPQRAAVRSNSGIKLSEDNALYLIPVRSSVSPKDFCSAEIVFVCTKAYDTATVAPYIAQLISPAGAAVSLQNGIGNTEIIEKYAEGRTLCATTSQAALLQNDFSVRHTGSGPTSIAPVGHTSTQQARQIADILTEAGLSTSINTNPQTMLWDKLLVNAAINPITAIYGINNGELLKNSGAFNTACSIAKEAAAVASAGNISLTCSDPVKAFSDVCRATASNRSSMLRDIENGRKTEINAINGAIVKLAQKLNVAAPANIELIDTIKKLEKS